MAENKVKAIIVLAIAVVWTASLRTALTTILKCIVALLCIFIIPGVLFIRFLSPSKRGIFEWCLLSLGISVALLSPLALLLHRFNALTPIGWGTALALFCLAAWHYSGRGPVAKTASFDAGEKAVAASSPGARWGGGWVARLSCVVLAIATAVGIARNGALNHRQFAYTEMWMLPSRGNDSQRVTIGVRNEEKQGRSYDLELTLNGKLIERRSSLLVRSGDTWVEEAATQFTETNKEQVVEAKLYRTEQPSLVYRHTLLKFNHVGDVSGTASP